MRHSRKLRTVLAVATALLFAAGGTTPLLAIARSFATSPNRVQQPLSSLLPIRFDEKTGRLQFELPASGQEMLYQVWTASGTEWPAERVPAEPLPLHVRFDRQGARVLLLALDSRFRASSSDSSALLRMHAELVPAPVLWSFTIVSETGNRLLIDATDFVLRDAAGTGLAIRGMPDAGFRLDPARNSIIATTTHAFETNTEVETQLTFVSEQPASSWSSRVSPDPHTVTVRQRHSFVALPKPGYRVRAADPRLGLTALAAQDLSAPFSNNYAPGVITRFRLEKRNADAQISDPVQPIMVYLEASIPAEYRDAVRNGVLYWNRVLQAAGFRDAVRVQELPAGADPLDIRYPIVVIWASGNGRRTSFATRISDPRTGEVLKSIITLDGYRSLEDYNRYATLRPALAKPHPTSSEYVMARRRWLAAHEMGHALSGQFHYTRQPSQVGFRLPTVRVNAAGLLTVDLGTGDVTDPLPYDEALIRYVYAEFPPRHEAAALDSLARDAVRHGFGYVSDDIGANPLALSRMGGSDVLTELSRERKVRRVMLAHFGPAVLQPGEPVALLFDRLVPAYFEHRLAIQAAAKAIGGADWFSTVAGNGDTLVALTPPAYQRRAIRALLELLQPEELEIPARIATFIPPRPFVLSPSVFQRPTDAGEYTYHTGEAGFVRIGTSAEGLFDPVAWARALADIVTGELVRPDRAARLVAMHVANADVPSLDELISTTIAATWHAPVPADSRHASLQRVTQWSVLERLCALVQSPQATPEVRAASLGALNTLLLRLNTLKSSDETTRGHIALSTRAIRKVLEAR